MNQGRKCKGLLLLFLFIFFIWLLKMRSLTRTGSEEDEILLAKGRSFFSCCRCCCIFCNVFFLHSVNYLIAKTPRYSSHINPASQDNNKFFNNCFSVGFCCNVFIVIFLSRAVKKRKNKRKKTWKQSYNIARQKYLHKQQIQNQSNNNNKIMLYKND